MVETSTIRRSNEIYVDFNCEKKIGTQANDCITVKSKGLKQEIKIRSYGLQLTNNEKQYVCEFISALVKNWVGNGYIKEDQSVGEFRVRSDGLDGHILIAYSGGQDGYLFPLNPIFDNDPAKPVSDRLMINKAKYQEDVDEMIKKLNLSLPLSAEMVGLGFSSTLIFKYDSF